MKILSRISYEIVSAVWLVVNVTYLKLYQFIIIIYFQKNSEEKKVYLDD